jgi:hypothetical protein
VIAEGEAVRMEGILRRQEGVISLRQAVGAGLGARGVSNRVASGRWERVHPRVFRATDHAFTDRARLRGAALWAAPRAAVSGLAAAWWHGLVECCPAVIELTLPRDRHPAARPGLRVRRRDLAQADLVSVRGIWLTAVPLTVLECAVALGQAGPTFLDRALQRHVRLETLRAAHRRNLGQHGSKAVGLLLAAAARGGESEAERRLVALLRRAGIEGWQLGYLVDGYRLDLAFPRRAGRRRGGRLGLPPRRRAIPPGPPAAERAGTGRLDDPPVHLGRPHPPPGRRPHRDPSRPRGLIADSGDSRSAEL